MYYGQTSEEHAILRIDQLADGSTFGLQGSQHRLVPSEVDIRAPLGSRLRLALAFFFRFTDLEFDRSLRRAGLTSRR